jgi:hypothetical protein
VFTAFQEYLGAFYRSDDGPRDIHAFDYPFGGMVLEVIDADESHDIDAVLDYIRTVRGPQVFGAGVALGTAFTPFPLPEDRMSYVKQVEGLGKRVTMLWFTDGAAVDSWDAGFAGADRQAEKSGVGRCELVAPFKPTIPGTDTYVDQLR